MLRSDYDISVGHTVLTEDQIFDETLDENEFIAQGVDE
jgi:hypothetical protein